jgi:hypothetical protein
MQSDMDQINLKICGLHTINILTIVIKTVSMSSYSCLYVCGYIAKAAPALQLWACVFSMWHVKRLQLRVLEVVSGVQACWVRVLGFELGRVFE